MTDFLISTFLDLGKHQRLMIFENISNSIKGLFVSAFVFFFGGGKLVFKLFETVKYQLWSNYFFKTVVHLSDPLFRMFHSKL